VTHFWPPNDISVFLNITPVVSLELVKLGASNIVWWLIHRSTNAGTIYYRRKTCSESCDFLKYWEISDNILLTVEDSDIVAMEH